MLTGAELERGMVLFPLCLSELPKVIITEKELLFSTLSIYHSSGIRLVVLRISFNFHDPLLQFTPKRKFMIKISNFKKHFGMAG